MSKHIFLILFPFIFLLSPCISISGQSGLKTPALDFNKKEADEALTDSLCVFSCQQSNAADSVFVSLFGKYTKNKTLPIAIKHRRYGELPPDIEMSFPDFICMFMDDFDIYCAIDEHKDKKLNITLVLKNKEYDYIHMLLIQSSRQDVASGNVRLAADFYTYIPQHSVIKNDK